MDPRPNISEERTRCLTFQRARARMIKETFINEGFIDREEMVAKQVFKYSTLLSQKMLDKIKTEQLLQFERDVQEYCKESAKKEEAHRERQPILTQMNVSQHLSDYKNSNKLRIMQTQKKRTKTCQSFELAIEPGRMTSPEPPPDSKAEIPLGNKKIKQVLEHCRKKQAPGSLFRVNGKGMNSQIIQMLQKLNEIESIQKLRKRRERLNDEEQEYLQGRSDHLKRQKERLSTAADNHERPKFEPMGRIKKHQRSIDKNQLRIQQLDYLKKLHTRTNKGILQPLKKSSTIVSSSFVGKASIHLEEGLPKSIKDHIPHHIKMKPSNGSISIQDSDKPDILRSRNITPPLPRSNNLFITHAFA